MLASGDAVYDWDQEHRAQPHGHQINNDGQLSIEHDPKGSHMFISNMELGREPAYTFFRRQGATQEIKVAVQ